MITSAIIGGSKYITALKLSFVSKNEIKHAGIMPNGVWNVYTEKPYVDLRNKVVADEYTTKKYLNDLPFFTHCYNDKRILIPTAHFPRALWEQSVGAIGVSNIDDTHFDVLFTEPIWGNSFGNLFPAINKVSEIMKIVDFYINLTIACIDKNIMPRDVHFNNMMWRTTNFDPNNLDMSQLVCIDVGDFIPFDVIAGGMLATDAAKYVFAFEHSNGGSVGEFICRFGATRNMNIEYLNHYVTKMGRKRYGEALNIAIREFHKLPPSDANVVMYMEASIRGSIVNFVSLSTFRNSYAPLALIDSGYYKEMCDSYKNLSIKQLTKIAILNKIANAPNLNEQVLFKLEPRITSFPFDEHTIEDIRNTEFTPVDVQLPVNYASLNWEHEHVADISIPEIITSPFEPNAPKLKKMFSDIDGDDE